MSATERPRLRSRLALSYATAAVALGAVPVAVVGLGAWTGGSTVVPGGTTVGPGAPTGNTGPVLAAVALGLIVVALVAGPIGWALAGRALRPLRELTSAADGAGFDASTGRFANLR